ncbi:hypothetical protein Y032_0095g2786 [Ancylostoma ceylanicum]|uniref:Uncharacterized protein n=1 Tax=Ancylostoma ceylanicum TaxID=53326 RepID=A0A016TKD3_9BILA|nr:hypothetical protein Y032_0095g2786 [Ancylostoma ceylanicum]
MPRFKDGRTWDLIRSVAANCVRLVKEVLSLRQKIISERQCIHFLRRSLQHHVIPNFIAKKRLHEMCGLMKKSRQSRHIEEHILRTALKSKQGQMFSMLSKCVDKEHCCQRLVPDDLWKRIVGTYRLLQCSWSKNGSFFGGELKGPQARDLKRDESLRISFITVSKSLQTSYDYGFSTCDR